jgi:hypothetical protein
MSQTTYIKIPASTANKLAALGQAMLDLAQELERKSRTQTWAKPRNIPKDQEWFWTKEWQKGECEADDALAEGEYKDFDTVEALVADLHSQV